MSRFSLSPGRTISPIDEDFLLDLDVLSSPASLDEETFQPLRSCNLVSFSEIDAKITPLKAKGLETIFEGRFLETPPRGGGRTVIPRKNYDQNDGDSEEEEEDDQPIRPIYDSSYELLYEDEENLFKAHFGTLKTTNTGGCKDGDGEEAVSIICNSFKRRLNLIPGED